MCFHKDAHLNRCTAQQRLDAGCIVLGRKIIQDCLRWGGKNVLGRIFAMTPASSSIWRTGMIIRVNMKRTLRLPSSSCSFSIVSALGTSRSVVARRSSNTAFTGSTLDCISLNITSRIPSALAKNRPFSGRTISRPGTVLFSGCRRTSLSRRLFGTRPSTASLGWLTRQTRANRDTITAISSASSVSKVSTASSATTARTKSERRTRYRCCSLRDLDHARYGHDNNRAQRRLG